MTKDEIKALVAAKIAGQGSAIDAASVLPTILDAIVEAIPEVTPAPTPAEMLDALTLKSSNIGAQGFTDKTPSEAASVMGITDAEFAKFINGEFLRIEFTDYVLTVNGIHKLTADSITIDFGYYNNIVGSEGVLTTRDGGALWTLEYAEV